MCRDVEEVIKRAPSIDVQLAKILTLNSSNLSIDHAGVDSKASDYQPR